MSDAFFEWSQHPTWPSWIASHISGRYTERDPLDDIPEQKVEAHCTECGTTFKYTCASGAVRVHIEKFAREHAHGHDLFMGNPK